MHYIADVFALAVMKVKNIFWQLEGCWSLHFRIDRRRKKNPEKCYMNTFFDRLYAWLEFDKCVSLARIRHILWSWAQA